MKKLALVVALPVLLGACVGQNGDIGFFPDLRYDPLPRSVEATGKKTFLFDPNKMRWAAYDEEGGRVKFGRASGGVNACPEDGADCRTVVGEFKLERKGDGSCISKTYPVSKPGGGAPMAYCMFFHQGYAIHGSRGPVPDYHSSHGCIRVNVADAQWLNEDFMNVGSTVIVKPY